jgi:glycosyltransferase involved in cell wall biosynthesis
MGQYEMSSRTIGSERAIDVSVVIPMLNEEAIIAATCKELIEVLDAGSLTWEAIFIDDGSKDQTVACLEAAAAGDQRITILELTRCFGQTAAMAVGFKQAVGRTIVPMDADMQNDPRDIEGLVLKLDEAPGFDIVSGWRRNRHDKFITRRLPSMIANKLIARLTWTDLHDFGCSLKSYRREVLEDVALYGEMHRFLPAICSWNGARVTEHVVNHRPREHGQSKYGLRRTFKVLLDLVTVKFLGDYLAKPIYFFGKLGMVSMAGAFLTLTVAILQRFGYLYPDPGYLNLNRNVLVMFAMMLFLMSVMFLMLGVISELLVRIYMEGTSRKPYRIRRIRTGSQLTSVSPPSAAETSSQRPAASKV